MKIQTRKEYKEAFAKLRALRRKYNRDTKDQITYKERKKDAEEYGDIYVAIGEYEQTHGIIPKEIRVRLFA
jgi:hypothetical protein